MKIHPGFASNLSTPLLAILAVLLVSKHKYCRIRDNFTKCSTGSRPSHASRPPRRYGTLLPILQLGGNRLLLLSVLQSFLPKVYLR